MHVNCLIVNTIDLLSRPCIYICMVLDDYLRMEKLVQVAWLYHLDRRTALNKSLVNHVHGDLYGAFARTFPCPALQHPQPALLNSKFDVLHHTHTRQYEFI
jgi:hypothetical protein